MTDEHPTEDELRTLQRELENGMLGIYQAEKDIRLLLGDTSEELAEINEAIDTLHTVNDLLSERKSNR